VKLWLLLVVGVACSRHDHESQVEAEERAPRQLDPPPASVRALPPHAIRADGVGPYRLGATLEQVGNQVPSGARNAQDEIAEVVHLSVLHAEDDAILIGGEPLGRASFIAVVGGKIARTESGIHVGSTRDELVRALGAPVVDPDRARDPHVVVPSNLRELRAVLDGDRVIGLVVASAPPAPRDEGCTRPAIETDDALRPPRARFSACLTAGGDIVQLDGDELAVRALDGDKPIAATRIPNVVFAAPLRAPDGRDEIAVVTRTDDDRGRTWYVLAYRVDNNRLVKSVEPRVAYQVTPPQARTIGADLRDLDLALELVAHGDAIEVGGLLTTRRADGTLRDLVVLSPVQVPRRTVKSAPVEPVDAGITDAITTHSSP
jgi:hypothetical protein